MRLPRCVALGSLVPSTDRCRARIAAQPADMGQARGRRHTPAFGKVPRESDPPHAQSDGGGLCFWRRSETMASAAGGVLDGSVEPIGAPVSDLDPYSIEFLTDPFPFLSALRDVGPVVFLERYGVWAVSRHEWVERRVARLRDVFVCGGRGHGQPETGGGVEAAEQHSRGRSAVAHHEPSDPESCARPSVTSVLTGAVRSTGSAAGRRSCGTGQVRCDHGPR